MMAYMMKFLIFLCLLKMGDQCAGTAWCSDYPNYFGCNPPFNLKTDWCANEELQFSESAQKWIEDGKIFSTEGMVFDEKSLKETSLEEIITNDCASCPAEYREMSNEYIRCAVKMFPELSDKMFQKYDTEDLYLINHPELSMKIIT